jgi:D-sedoheptulose 7-phosphate isomerase
MSISFLVMWMLGEERGCPCCYLHSGNSQNVILATEAAKKKGMKVVGLLGKTGGKLKDMVDVPLIVDYPITDRIQEIHIKLIHIFIEGIERQIVPEHYA